MSSPSYWCHSCHSIVRLASSPRPTCPSCGFCFVEEISSEPVLVLVPSGRPQPSDVATVADNGSNSGRELAGDSDVGGRRRFLSRLLHSIRSNRPSSEARPPTILQIVELLQRSRNRRGTANDGDVGEPQRRALLMNEEASNEEDASLSLHDVSGMDQINGGERPGYSPVQTSESGSERPQDDALATRPFDIFLQRLVSNFLQSGRNGSPPASKAAVAAMPTFKLSKQHLIFDTYGGVDEAKNECAVCKEVFEIGGEVKEMPCKHVYHSGCIMPWLELHSSCPLCRREMPVDTEDEASSSTTPGVTGAGEPAVVFIGISGAGVYVFSFMVLGVSNRMEAITASNQEEEQVGQTLNFSEVERSPEIEEGETVGSNEILDESHAFTDTVLTESRNEGDINVVESAHVLGDDIEQHTEQQGIYLEGNQDRQLPVLQNHEDLLNETRQIHGDEGISSSQDQAGSTSPGTESPGERMMQELPTARQAGSSTGSSSRGFFSWVFRHAAPPSTLTTENEAEGCIAKAEESTGIDATSSIQSSNGSSTTN